MHRACTGYDGAATPGTSMGGVAATVGADQASTVVVMPYRGSFGVVMALHVLTAVFIVGPLGLATLAAPRLLRPRDPQAHRPTSLQNLRMALRSIRGLTLASVLVAGFGFVLVNQGSFGSVRGVTDPWVLASIILWALAVLINLIVVDRNLSQAIDVLATGGDTRRFVPVVALAGATSSACWTIIVVLMVVKPGA